MYPEYYRDLLKNAELLRGKNINFSPAALNEQDKKILLYNHHPDYKNENFKVLQAGKNKGEKLPKELCGLLEKKSIEKAYENDLSFVKYTVDVLVIGGGGAGTAAAIEAHKNKADVMIATKYRLGDSNTLMAQGGMQAVQSENDSPFLHFTDTFGGGGFAAKKELVSKLVIEGISALSWLEDMGVLFDKTPEGEFITHKAGGTSRKRIHSAKDYTGKEIMRTLCDEVLNLGIKVLEYNAAQELIKDENGNIAGAVLLDTITGQTAVVKAKAVVIATGGAGSLHIGGFETTNFKGSSADGLALAYKAGCRLVDAESMQYHPTSAAFPEQISGMLVSEKARSLGAKLLNKSGNVFINPLETRDVVTAAIIRECEENGGIQTENGKAVWLDTPMIDLISGKGTAEKQLPVCFKTFLNFGIDISKEPILVYPAFHYQNGGIEIDENCFVSGFNNLFAAGEVTGGIHGKNRLMGNSLLDIIVFGRTAGENAAKTAKKSFVKATV